MDFRHYADPCVDVVVDLVNAFASDPLEASGAGPASTAALADLLRRHGIDDTGIGAVDVAAVRQLADRLHEVFAATRPGDAVAVVNDVLRSAGALPQISGHDAQDWHLHYDASDAAPLDRVAATAAMGLATVICTSGTGRLGRCDGTACRDVFVDTSRNNRRRFCSDSCGNAAHVAAHRARRRDQASA